MSEHRRSPNVLTVGDVVRVCLPTTVCSFIARIKGFNGGSVHVEAVSRSDDPWVDDEFHVPWASIGMAGPMDHLYHEKP